MAARTLVKIPDHVAQILRNAEISGPNKTHLSITEKLSPKIYKECAKILEMLGGKWNRSAQATVFPKPISEVLAEALDDGEVVNTKSVRQAFYTPDTAADRLVELADLVPGLSYLEPSAGHGALIKALSRAGWNLRKLHAVEMDKDACDFLTGELPDAIKDSGFDGLNVEHMDFLEYRLSNRLFDRVIMNPPFSSGQDAQHVMHGLKFLKPNGILMAIVPPTILTKNNGAYDRLKYILDHDGCAPTYHVESFDLPEGSFKESGTNIRTCVLKITRTA